jgi:ribosome-associated translation inhibitor RaiA
MQIIVETDSRISGSAPFKKEVQAVIQASLERYENKITRVIVHFADQDGPREVSETDDKRCTIEARIKKSKPLVVSADANNVDAALLQAADKMRRSIKKTAGKTWYRFRK